MADPRLFREEALAALERGDQDGDVIRISPAWTRGSYWILLLVGLVALVFAVLARVTETAEGHAIVVGDARGPAVVAWFSDAGIAPGMTLEATLAGRRVALTVEEVQGGPVTVARAALPAALVVPAGTLGPARVVLRRRPLLSFLGGGAR